MKVLMFTAANTVLATTGILIQLKLLYPWHEMISHEVAGLQAQQDDLEKRVLSLALKHNPSLTSSVVAANKDVKPSPPHSLKWW